VDPAARRTGVTSTARIATVTANPALDVTYYVDRLVPGGEHRVVEVRERAGGKGVNTAGVLRCLGEPVIATGLLGGDTADRIREGLARAGIDESFVAIEGATRRTVVVVAADEGTATLFNEPGPRVTAAEWSALRTDVERRATDLSVLTFSGSLPPGVDVDAYADLVAAARAAGTARVVVDTSGRVMAATAAAGPDLMKPNVSELLDAMQVDDPMAGVAELRRLGARAVAVSAGADGLVLSTPSVSLRAQLDEPLAGNATGAGDAAVAAFARALARPGPDPLTDAEAARTMLAEAVAVSAAAVLAPVAGIVDAKNVGLLLTMVHVRDV
jgi:1-phosphofructokinase family hexose kinase